MDNFYTRVKVATATTGTGTITLGSAATGYASFVEAGVVTGQTVSYCIEDGQNFECGRGVYTSANQTLTRAQILISKLNGSAADTTPINLSGSAIVFLTALGDDLATLNIPDANDDKALGSATRGWSDLFFASGAVVNYNDGDVTVTHSANKLAFAGASGGYTFDAPVITGYTATLSIAGVTPNQQQFGTNADTGSHVLGMFSATAATAAELQFYRSKNAAIGSATVVADGDSLGKITWIGAQQTGTFATQNQAAQIRAEVDGTVTSGASGDMPGRLVFSTTANGSGSLTDRIILTADGTLRPATDGGVTLGTSALGWGNQFMASGTAVNWGNGNASIAHSTGVLVATAGTFRVSGLLQVDAQGGAEGGEIQLQVPVSGHTLNGTHVVLDVNGNSVRIFESASPNRGVSIDLAALSTSGQLALGGTVTGTVQTTTGGTAIDFPSLPAAIKRITVMLNEVSLSGTDNILVQIGDSGGLETTGYSSGSSIGVASTVAQASSTAGFIVIVGNASRNVTGHMTLTRLTGNTWVASHSMGTSVNVALAMHGGGSKSLSAELDRVRVTVTGANTIDTNGGINISYEL